MDESLFERTVRKLVLHRRKMFRSSCFGAMLLLASLFNATSAFGYTSARAEFELSPSNRTGVAKLYNLSMLHSNVITTLSSWTISWSVVEGNLNSTSNVSFNIGVTGVPTVFMTLSTATGFVSFGTPALNSPVG